MVVVDPRGLETIELEEPPLPCLAVCYVHQVTSVRLGSGDLLWGELEAVRVRIWSWGPMLLPLMMLQAGQLGTALGGYYWMGGGCC